PDEVVVLHRKGKYVEADHSLPDFTGYSAEDLLLDPRIFDSEVYGPKTKRQKSRYRVLSAKPASKRTAKQTKELQQLAAELASQQLPVTDQNKEIRTLQALLEKYKL
ncbi:MAG: hypothetical protein IIC95_05840, partial [Chloroflexi bacterium]|nr:hypothetical protein [Chloroflexota bacterium]